MRKRLLIGTIAFFGLVSSAAAGIGPVVTCCMVTCDDPPWTACGAFIDCPSGPCSSTPTENNAAGECGAGDFASCPTSESGQCADGVNNDEYLNSLTDCDDPACTSDPACAAPTPTATATATPVPKKNDDDDGCQIGAAHSSMGSSVLLAPLALLVWRRCLRRTRRLS